MANRIKIPPRLYPQMLARVAENGDSFRMVAAWLRSEHGLRVSGEAVRKVVRRLQAAPPPAPPLEDLDDSTEPDLEDAQAQSERIAKLCWRELRRAQRIVRQSPTEWRRLHSALSLTSRQVQAQLRPARSSDDRAGQPPQAPDVFALPTFGPPAQKPEAS